MKMNVTHWMGCLAAVMACTAARAGVPEPQKVAQNFEVERYMGTWYEIARFRELAEAGCDNAKATYTLQSNGHVAVVNECDRLGAIHTRFDADLYAPDPKEPARGVLQITTAGITRHAAYNVLAVDDDYQWALVGEPERDSLWVLSRTPNINVEALRTLVSRAETEFGYKHPSKHLHCTRQPEGANKTCEEVLDD